MVSEPRPIVLGGNVIYALALAGSAQQPAGVLLIDAGPDFAVADRGDSWVEAVAQAAAHGFAPTDVRVVLVTHAHIDHAGLAQRWAEAGARVLAGADDLPAVRAGAAHGEAATDARREELRSHGCPLELLDLLLARGQPALRWQPCPSAEPVEDRASFALEGGAELRVVAAPGHTPGNLGAFVEASGDLYSGDTVLPETIPTPGLHFPGGAPGASGARWPSLPAFLDSVRRLRALSPRRVLPGHGAAVDDPARLFSRFERHHERRNRRISALLADRPDSAYGIAMRLFPHLPAERVRQAMTEVIGHLDVLLAAGEATPREDADGVLLFRLSVPG